MQALVVGTPGSEFQQLCSCFQTEEMANTCRRGWLGGFDEMCELIDKVTNTQRRFSVQGLGEVFHKLIYYSQ